MILRRITIIAAAAFAVAAMMAFSTGVAVLTGNSFGGIAKTAGACGFTWNNYTSNGGTDAGGDSKMTDIHSAYDGCGNRQYRYSIWSPNGASLSNIRIGYRAWSCGTLVQQQSTFAQVVWSGWIYYGSCGDQTDDYATTGSTYACSRFSCYDSANFGIFYDNL